MINIVLFVAMQYDNDELELAWLLPGIAAATAMTINLINKEFKNSHFGQKNELRSSKVIN